MNLLLTGILINLALAAWFFYDAFTKRGTIPLAVAFRALTVWLSALGVVLGDYVVQLFGWAATHVDFLQERFGALLANPSAGEALQLISWFFLVLRLKGQGMPALKLPDFPDPADAAGADRP